MQQGGMEPLLLETDVGPELVADKEAKEFRLGARQARLLGQAALAVELARPQVLYLSRYIIQNKNEYYRLLREVTVNGAWEPWVMYMLSAVEETATWTCEKIKAIRDLLEETAVFCRENLPASVYSRELMDLIFAQP